MNSSRRAFSRHSGQLARFGAVGAVCAVTDFGLFALLIALGAPPIPANIGSFLVANGQGYVLNGRLTFRQDRESLSLKGYGKFLGAYSASLVLSTVIVGVLSEAIGPLFAKGIATGVAAVWNYALSALVVFRRSSRAKD
jgi:putative flippase GtrA